MNQKITQSEFEKWGEQLFEMYAQITSPVSGLQFQNEVDREKWMKFGVTVSGYTKSSVIQAVFVGILNFQSLKLKTDVPVKALDNQTIEEWVRNVGERIKEHCIANGYWKPDSPSDLTQLKERGKKVIKILLDKGDFYKYIIYADSEEREVLVNTSTFFRELKKIVSPIMFEEDGDIPPKLNYFYEDAIGRVEKLISKKEKVEKMNKPSSSNSPVSKPSSTEYKVNNTVNATQKETYQKILDETKKDLGDKEKEKDKLNKSGQNPTSSHDNNNKLNWAIGLGIVAVLIGLICLILFASRRKEK